MPKTILILAANPSATARLHLDREIRDVQNGLERSTYRDRFRLEIRHAVRRQDIRRAMLDLKPAVVHFCGHGSAELGDEGLIFEDDDGRATAVDAETLQDFFAMFADHVRCVVLNACYSRTQAEAIGRQIDFVVGMKDAISDDAARAYTEAFYDGLGAGKTVVEAHGLARNAVQWAKLDEQWIPHLYVRPGADSNLLSHGGDRNPHPRWGAMRSIGIMVAVLLIVVSAVFWSRSDPPDVSSNPTLYAVRIQILDPDGGVLKGAAVRASAGNEPHLLPDGWWQIEIPDAKVPEDRKVAFWAEHPQWQSSLRQELRLSSDANPRLEIRLRAPESRIAGSVVDRQGRAIGAARVTVRGHDAEPAVTDLDGRFVLTVPAAAGQSVRVHVEHRAFSPKDVHCYAARDDCAAVLSPARP